MRLLTNIKSIAKGEWAGLGLFRDNPVILILLAAAILRFWGIWHDYPFSYYPDEQHFVNRAISFGSGDLNPHWFHKPAFLMYILFFEYGIFFLIGKIIGFFPSVDAFAVYYFQNTWPFILIGRITVALFGIATVFATYKIGEKFWSKTAGVYASMILAVCYGHIFSGQDVKADVPTTFFTVMSVYYLLQVVKNDFKKRDYLLTGIFAGLGMGTKYYSIALLPCFLLVPFYEAAIKKRPMRIVNYLYPLVSFWVVYFLVSPFNFLDALGRRATFGQIVNIWNAISPVKLNIFSSLEGKQAAQFLAENYEGPYILKSFIDYLRVLVSTQGAGLIIGTLFCLSLLLLFKKPFKNLVLLSFPLIFAAIAIIMDPSYTEPRHQLIIYPFFSIAAGILFVELSSRLRNTHTITMVLSLLLLFPLVSVIRNNIHVSKTDTRTMAKYWIEENIPAGTRMLSDEYAPVLNMSRQRLEQYHEKAKQVEPGQFTTHLERYYHYKILAHLEPAYDVKIIRFPWWWGREVVGGETEAVTEFDQDMANPIKTVGVNDYASYVSKGYEYAVAISFQYEKFVQENSSKSISFPSFKKFYHDLFSKGELVKEFNADEMNLPGPTVKVIKLR